MITFKTSKKLGYHNYRIIDLDNLSLFQYTSMMRLNLRLGASLDRKENGGKDLEEFINALLSIKSKEEMEDFLNS